MVGFGHYTCILVYIYRMEIELKSFKIRITLSQASEYYKVNDRWIQINKLNVKDNLTTARRFVVVIKIKLIVLLVGLVVSRNRILMFENITFIYV